MRGRPPTAPAEVTDRQREVARLVAEGLTNEQIAERMEISLAGAKYHVSELLGRLGLQRREEIAEWYAREHGGRWRERLRAAVGLPAAALVGGVATATGVVIFVVAFVLALDSGGGATEAPDAMSGYRAYTAEELVDLGFVDLGRLLVTVGAIESSIRHDLVAVRLPGPAELLMESGGIGWQEAGCCSPLNLASETAAHSYHLTVWPLPERTALARSVSSANGRIVWEVTVEGIGAAEHPSLAIEVRTARTRPDKLPVASTSAAISSYAPKQLRDRSPSRHRRESGWTSPGPEPWAPSTAERVTACGAIRGAGSPSHAWPPTQDPTFSRPPTA